MTEQQQHQAEQQQRLVAVGADMDRLARVRREREQREPCRWQQREPCRAANRWRMVA